MHQIYLKFSVNAPAMVLCSSYLAVHFDIIFDTGIMMANVFERSNILTASCNTFVEIQVEISSSTPWRKVWPHSRLFKMDSFSEDEFK